MKFDMAKKYKVIITPQARQHLTAIRDYILFELKSPTAAGNTLSVLKKAVESLEQMPERIPFTDEEKWRERGVHRMPVKNYLIYFTVNKEDTEVYIFAILYARRDQIKVLNELE